MLRAGSFFGCWTGGSKGLRRGDPPGGAADTIRDVSSSPPVTSRRNPLVARFRAALAGEDRDSFVVEGIRALEEGACAPERLELVVASPRAGHTDRGRALLERLTAAGLDVREATEEVLDACGGTRASQGVAALARRREIPFRDLVATAPTGAPFVVAAVGVGDPGNVGTCLRTADAAGATGFATARDTVSPWNDKAVRATAGSIFRLPIASGVELDALREGARSAGARLVASVSREGVPYGEADLRPPLVLLLGSEGAGVPQPLLEAADLRVTIPIRAGVESLNVAAAAAVLCFEISRQAGLAR